MNAVEMIAHCMHHQSANDRPFCERCGVGTLLAGNCWYCPECLRIVERRDCPYCDADGGDGTAATDASTVSTAVA